MQLWTYCKIDISLKIGASNTKKRTSVALADWQFKGSFKE